jgi:hypothetical protein
MKHQYFGDVNDYVKYGILRCIAAEGLRVAVCWMLTPNDSRPDGRKTQYLSTPGVWERHDSELFSHLARILATSDGKHVRHIESPDVIPNARFFGREVPLSLQERHVWLREVISAAIDSDLVFFDPDNGIEIPSCPFGKRGHEKYVYWSELVEAWRSNRSVLVFQHFPRVPREQFIVDTLANMEVMLQGSGVVALVTGNVVFLLAAQACHWPAIERLLARLEGKWAPRVRAVAPSRVAGRC